MEIVEKLSGREGKQMQRQPSSSTAQKDICLWSCISLTKKGGRETLGEDPAKNNPLLPNVIQDQR